jgi:N-acetylmuramoyl-L-alanine amidase
MSESRFSGWFAFALTILLSIGGTQRAWSEQPAPPAPAAKSACHRTDFRVVIDVGHTIDSPGADSARGVPEYQFNLALAGAIKDKLAEDGFDSAVRLVTTTKHMAGLVERPARANAMRADLFISVHHDSVPNNLIETWDYEGQQHRFSDRFSGYSIFVSIDNGDYKGSLAFGHLLGTALQARGLHYTPHYTLPLMGRHRRVLVDAQAGVYRFDQLVVLRGTRMPAVLLEAGSIVNRQDELTLATPERRTLVADAVTAAVDQFCADRTRPAAAPAPGHPKPVALTR